VRRSEKDVFPSPFKDHQTLEASISHQVGVFLLLLFKGENSDHLGFFFPGVTFNVNLEKIYSYKIPWEEMND